MRKLNLFFNRVKYSWTAGILFLALSNLINTSCCRIDPVLELESITGLSSTTAHCESNVESRWLRRIDEKGVCWSKSTNPVIDIDNYTTDGPGAGSFESHIIRLIPETEYSVRPYVIFSSGFWIFRCTRTYYGNEMSITTLPLEIVWQRCYGGSNNEWINSFTNNEEGNYVFSGGTNSTDGDISINEWNDARWIVEISPIGDIIREKTYQSKVRENSSYHIQTPDGGYAVGYTIDNKFGLMKINSDWNEEWQRSYGGRNTEELRSMTPSADGGIVLAGFTESNDGDVVGLHHDDEFYRVLDIWIVKTTAAGEIDWQKCLGGTHIDNVANILLTSDNGYIVLGYTECNDGDVVGGTGGRPGDAWVIKLNSTGDIEWQKAFNEDEYEFAKNATECNDGSFVVVMDGNIIGDYLNEDFRIVKFSPEGSVVWDRTYGGSRPDHPLAVTNTFDGGYLVVGLTQSSDGDITHNHGSQDAWLVKLDRDGELEWQKTFGGSMGDRIGFVSETYDGGLILAGSTSSDDGDIPDSHGGMECWVAKLGGE